MIIRLLVCSNKHNFYGHIIIHAKKRLPKETLLGNEKKQHAK